MMCFFFFFCSFVLFCAISDFGFVFSSFALLVFGLRNCCFVLFIAMKYYSSKKMINFT